MYLAVYRILSIVWPTDILLILSVDIDRIISLYCKYNIVTGTSVLVYTETVLKVGKDAWTSDLERFNYVVRPAEDSLLFKNQLVKCLLFSAQMFGRVC